jgi:hypothetical protein
VGRPRNTECKIQPQNSTFRNPLSAIDIVLPQKPALSSIEWACPELVERAMLSDCSFPFPVIPDPIRNPVLLSLKDQKTALLEQRIIKLLSMILVGHGKKW